MRVLDLFSRKSWNASAERSWRTRNTPGEKDIMFQTNEWFEIKALAFRKMTGCWPPGKDWPAAAGPRDEERDRKVWSAWVSEYSEVLDALYRAMNELHPPDSD